MGILQKDVTDSLKVDGMKNGLSVSSDKGDINLWSSAWFLILFVTLLVLVILTTGLIIFYCCYRRKKLNERSSLRNTSAALPTYSANFYGEKSTGPPIQLVKYQTALPSVIENVVQPEDEQPSKYFIASESLRLPKTGTDGTPTPTSSTNSTPLFHRNRSTRSAVSTDSAPPHPSHTKNLLQRRSSSHSSLSLTIDLTSSESNANKGLPRKDSPESAEMLSQCSHRMKRDELKICLRNLTTVTQEFWEIPMNHPNGICVPGSGMKNRYRTIVPNEPTRVIIPNRGGDPISSYINANYIRGYNNEQHAYIATQGPMTHTINDFWEMIWFEKAPCIVMITNLKERGRVKCENYLPDFYDDASGDPQSGMYGKIAVSILSQKDYEAYSVRFLVLEYAGEYHKCLHYWFTAWPDHKTPDSARQLLDLVKHVEENRKDRKIGRAMGPVVVHCSAGIGRTGCFIGASIGIRQLQYEKEVDVLSIVGQMRLDRGGMVQTNEQYEFIHQTLILFEIEMDYEQEPVENHWALFTNNNSNLADFSHSGNVIRPSFE